MKNLKMVMFPTEKANENSILKMSGGHLIKPKRSILGNKIFDVGVSASVYSGSHTPQHLYLVMVGVKTLKNEPIINLNLSPNVLLSGGIYTDGDSRILASTDTNCGTPCHDCQSTGSIAFGLTSCNRCEGTGIEKHLSEIPSELVSLFIEKYNKGLELSDSDFSKFICKKCDSLAIDSKSLMNYHNIQHPHDGSKSEFETELKDCLKCSSCGNSWTNANNEYNYEDYPMNSNPNVPNFITGKKDCNLQSKLQPIMYKYGHWNNGRWCIHYENCHVDLDAFHTCDAISDCGHLKINGKLLKTGKELNAKDYREGQWFLFNWFLEYYLKPKVDFEVIKNYDEILTHLEDISEDMCEKLKNFKLFFDVLGKSSSFAHKAHKELRDK